jgi:hypothetical protein
MEVVNVHKIEHIIELAAIVLVVIAGRAAFLHFWPYRPCRWCRKGGLIRGSWPAVLLGVKPGKRRRRRCWRCGNTKLTRRWGAFQVHHVKLSLIHAWNERGAD